MESDNLQTLTASSGYKFSAMKIADLGSAQYTLVEIVMDASGSVEPFAKELEQMLRTILGACNEPKNPYRDQLMIRVTQFQHTLTEIHGFKTLNQIKEADYTGALNLGGSTALFDAADEAIQTMTAYGKQLTDSEFLVNGIVILVTDGEDNASQIPVAQVKRSAAAAKKAEALESIRTILVGVTNDPKLSSYLQTFKDDAGIDQYVMLGDATPKRIAKLAEFISQSVSSTSSNIGKGPSQPITPIF